MIELKGIRKYFSSNGVTALDGADFDLREGEIHALLGENGAGKSTLMHIMAGYTKPGAPDAAHKPYAAHKHGSIFVDGKEQRFSSPSQCLAAGIGMIRQHPHQVPGFLVWESCIVGSENSPWLNRRPCRERIMEINKRFHFDLPLDVPTENLTVSQGQKAAILSLLLRDVRYLIFDEPTAVLTPDETQNLFELFATLRDQGKGIVLISHKLEETLQIAERVTVLRQGKTQICCKPGDLSDDALYEYIFGDTAVGSKEGSTDYTDYHGRGGRRVRGLRGGTRKGKEEEESSVETLGTTDHSALSLANFTVNVPGRPLIRGINLELPRGKIMGIAGVRDSGLETLELALTGFLPSSGALRINGVDLTGGGSVGNNAGRGGERTVENCGERNSAAKRVRAFRAAGGTYLDTRNEGTMLPIRDLLIIHSHRRFQKRSILNQKKINKWIENIMAAAGISFNNRAADGVASRNAFSAGNFPASGFSGGQLQRLLLAREMEEDGGLLVLSDPGRGLDREYRKTLAALLREKTAEGKAVLIFSTDLEELLALCDSIAVLRDGVFSRVIELDSDDRLSSPETFRNVPEIIREAMVGRT